MSAKQLTTSYTDFETNRLTFTDFQENDRSKGQLISYPRYDHPTLGENQPLMLQLPWMNLSTYGIPREGEYYKTSYDRGFIKTPLVTDGNEVVTVLVGKLKEMDKLWGSDKNKKKFFGKKWKKYKYQSIFRESPIDEDDENSVVRPAYMKLKLDLAWPDGEVKTKIYNSVLNEDGKRERTEVECSTVDDVAGVIRWKSNIRPIIRPVKMWAQPASRSDPGYGIVWKIVKIEVEPSENSGGSLYKSYYNNDAFLDSDDDENEVVNVKADDSSDSSDSSSDDEEEVNVKTKGKKKKSSSKV